MYLAQESPTFVDANPTIRTVVHSVVVDVGVVAGPDGDSPSGHLSARQEGSSISLSNPLLLCYHVNSNYSPRRQVISRGSVCVFSEVPVAIFLLPGCTAAVALAHRPAELP